MEATPWPAASCQVTVGPQGHPAPPGKAHEGPAQLLGTASGSDLAEDEGLLSLQARGSQREPAREPVPFLQDWQQPLPWEQKLSLSGQPASRCCSYVNWFINLVEVVLHRAAEMELHKQHDPAPLLLHAPFPLVSETPK
ncbi:Homeobox protein TGIF2 [Sciurus carolinensis]|uniref:Homeobox protein TGIF2 n=1 Tax=Sciurus carolinensis TaxID=30640 RepID=A0AA41ND63_SCICA|nr:Homeobox protein TGIF2 [Sciurus carolinensis]